MTGRPPLRVLVADDHPLFRQGLRGALEGAPGIELVGEAASGAEALAAAVELRPDVVLMDLRMPGGGGVEATRRLRDARPETRVLVLTMHEDDDSVFAALRAGARGYLLKGSDEEDILRAIRSVAAGEAIFGPAIAARLVSYFGVERPAPFPGLTPRERTILALLAEGRSNQSIAGELTLSLKTVRNNVSSIFTKLQVPDRAQAIVKARAAGLGGAGGDG
jgi:DNA-binding NarL/FixJ family response regulator